MERTAITTADAPAAIGPYSQAITVGDFVFCSGQLALRPDGTFNDGEVSEQTRQALSNLSAVLAAAGSSLDQVIKTTVFLQDMNDFAAMNAVYNEFFTTPYPARSTIQVARLPRDARVEVEAVALRG